jgi:hypothetical protein
MRISATTYSRLDAKAILATSSSFVSLSNTTLKKFSSEDKEKDEEDAEDKDVDVDHDLEDELEGESIL